MLNPSIEILGILARKAIEMQENPKRESSPEINGVQEGAIAHKPNPTKSRFYPLSA
jgi:hypothetical protein